MADLVLAYSIRKRTKEPVEITPMIDNPHWEYSKAHIIVGTGFSLRRWFIPEWCDWEGRAIYMDADQIVLGDVAELWAWPDKHPSPGTSAWMTYQPDKYNRTPWPRSDVMVIACNHAKDQWGWHKEKILKKLKHKKSMRQYADFMHATWMDPQPGQIDKSWNRLNRLRKGSTNLLHYTVEPKQPWYSPNEPDADIWKKEFKEAISAGAIPRDAFEDAIARWGKREDFRRSNGLHPHYKSYAKYF